MKHTCSGGPGDNEARLEAGGGARRGGGRSLAGWEAGRARRRIGKPAVADLSYSLTCGRQIQAAPRPRPPDPKGRGGRDVVFNDGGERGRGGAEVEGREGGAALGEDLCSLLEYASFGCVAHLLCVT
jgi:hypothetical protein